MINSTGSAFTNDFGTPNPALVPVKARILLGAGTSEPGAAGIYVNTGGSLSGNGIVNKDTILQGGVVAPGGVAVGTLTFSENLTLATGLGAGSLQFTLRSAADQIAVSGGKILDIGAGLLGFASFQFTTGEGFAVAPIR